MTQYAFGPSGTILNLLPEQPTVTLVNGQIVPAGPTLTPVPDAAQVGWLIDSSGNVEPPSAAPAVSLAALQMSLCADINMQAENQRQKYITPGAGQAMVYLLKQTQAAQALAALAASPPMTAAQGAAAYVLLAAEIGITVDPSTSAPAADVFGVARAVAAVVQRWLPLAALIEGERLKVDADIVAATSIAAAQAAHDAVAWPQ